MRSVRTFVAPLLLALGLWFSFFLMFHTFSYDTHRHELRISTKAWSDFGAHIPLIRSFSRGENLSRLLHVSPVESPLFPGTPIRYHFGFYALVGALERIGMPLDWALNLPSALGFFALLLGIWLVSDAFFASTFTSVLSVLFFVCNGSLSAIAFFRQHPLGPGTIADILTNTRFPTFGPWDGQAITAFWTLNIYTNQRHLAFSYALFLFLLLSVQKGVHIKHRAVLYAGILGTLMFVNFAVFGIACLFLPWIFLRVPHERRTIIAASLLCIPALLLLHAVSQAPSPISWEPGYLSHATTVTGWVSFWIQNIGLHALLIPIGMMLSPKKVRRLLVVPLVVLFLLPNLFRFSPDMINNHKFFNFFMILGSMFSAHAVWRVLKGFGKIRPRIIGIPLQGIVLVELLILLTLSGVIDLFPVLNDTKGTIKDVPADSDVTYFLTHTNTTDIIANSTWFYHPASLAGRSVASGYTYFTWSYGYDQSAREDALRAIYEAPNLSAMCDATAALHVAFVELHDSPEEYLRPNRELWNSLPAEYTNDATHRRVFRVSTHCP